MVCPQCGAATGALIAHMFCLFYGDQGRPYCCRACHATPVCQPCVDAMIRIIDVESVGSPTDSEPHVTLHLKEETSGRLQ
jgi:hypothetical protein